MVYFDKVKDITKLRPEGDKADVTVWDEGMPGFGIRFRNGDGVYCVQYRINGRQGKKSFGHVSRISLKKAKELAREAFGEIADALDPVKEAAKKITRAIRFRDKVETFIADAEKAGRSVSYVNDLRRSLGGNFGTDKEVKGYFQPLHKYTFGELEGQDGRALIAAELRRIEDEHGVGSMRNSRAHICAYLTWCFKEGLVNSNAATGTKKPPAVKRDRKLDPQTEIKALWGVLPNDDFGAICKLLWFTWARRDEIGSLRKSEVNREKRLIDLPPERTKNGIRHIIPLSTQAWAILEPLLDQRDGDFVFGSGKGGYGGWDKSVKRLREAVGTDHFTLHDFRRTARSLGVRRPVSIFPHIAEAILNHISTAESGKAGVAGVYDVNDPWQYHEEKAEALQSWADYLHALTAPPLQLPAPAQLAA